MGRVGNCIGRFIGQMTPNVHSASLYTFDVAETVFVRVHGATNVGSTCDCS